MNATFFVLAGSILTAGVSMMMPTNTNITLSGATDAIVAETAEVKEPLRHSFNHEREPAVDVLQSIAAAYGLSFKFSDGVRKSNSGNMILNTQLNTFKGDYTLQEAVDAVRTRMHMTYGETVLAMTENELILMTLEEYNRSRIAIRVYPMPSWANEQHVQESFAISVRRLLEAKHDLSNTTIESINGTLVVAAAPEIHAEIVDMAEQLKALLTDFRAQQQQADQAADARRLAVIERIRDEFAKVRDTLLMVRKEISRTQSDLNIVSINAFDPKPEESAREAMDQRRAELQVKLESLKLNEEELLQRYEYLQQTLIESEYEELTALLD